MPRSLSLPDEEVDWAHWAPMTSPLFKWAGGKQRFLWSYRDMIPEFPGRYFEPFAGGLSMYFHVARRSATPVQARLSDANLRLVRTYQQVKKNWRVVNDELRQLEAAFRAAEDKGQMYYQVRAAHNATNPAPDAARFIFLMRTGWNGVFRVNQKGAFNVPHGVLKGEMSFPSAQEIEAVARVFAFADIRANSWESSVSDMKPGDFAFFDPPYYTDARTQLYESGRDFGFSSQEKLADFLVSLSERGIDFLLTNSAHPKMIELYSQRGLNVQAINMHRSINSKMSGRGEELELIIRPGALKQGGAAAAQLDLKMRIRRMAAERSK